MFFYLSILIYFIVFFKKIPKITVESKAITCIQYTLNPKSILQALRDEI